MHLVRTICAALLTAIAAHAACFYDSLPAAATAGASANIFQQQFDAVVNQLRSRHPGMLASPLAFADLSHFDSLVRVTKVRLQDAESPTNFYFVVRRFIACLGDGHMDLLWPAPHGTSLPIDLAWVNDSLYVVRSYRPQYDSLVHKSVVSLCGVPVADLEARTNEHVPADADVAYLKRTLSPRLMVQTPFLTYLGLVRGVDSAAIVVSVNGSIAQQMIETGYQGGHASLFIGTRNACTALPGDRRNRFQVMKEKRLLYLQLNSMPHRGARAFLRKAFRQARRAGADHLVVDLRNCGGGDSRWCNALLARIVSRKQPIRTYEGWRRAEGANVKVNPGVEAISPARPGHGFEGRTYVLTSAVTASSATFIVLSVKDNHLGTIVGEPCGNTGKRFGDYRTLRLPVVGLTFRYSTKAWIRVAAGENEERTPIQPDALVRPTVQDMAAGRDRVWDFAVESLLAREKAPGQ